MMKLGASLLAGGLLFAAPLQAQTSHTHGAHEGGANAHCAMHQAKHGGGEAAAAGEHAMHGADAVHRYAPKLLLQNRAMLQLTAAQVEQFEALQAQHKAECQERMARVKAAEAAAAAALELATPDVQLFETKSREAANLKIDCKVDMVRIGQQALAALTAEQRAHLAHMNHGGH
jgi:hypothetical protein